MPLTQREDWGGQSAPIGRLVCRIVKVDGRRAPGARRPSIYQEPCL